MDPLEAMSPVDGRYRRHTQQLAEIFSEKGLIKRRIMVEGEYLIALSEHPDIDVREFTAREKNRIRSLSAKIRTKDAKIVKAIETKGYGNRKPTNHDVKAVEYFMKDRLKGTSLGDSLEWIHFALTSEDINNIAYSSQLRDGLEVVMIPALNSLQEKLDEYAQMYKKVPMIARTHGQHAVPTTFGKEFKVFENRLKTEAEELKNQKILVKLNGASGNYNAHFAAYPDVDWIKFTYDFVKRFNYEHQIEFKPNFVTTQIEPHDNYAKIFDNIKRVNTIVIDLDQDMWRYISDDWIKQKVVEGEVGSSTMPQKVNPIDFENSEGNLGTAISMLEYFSRKLPISRLQRDLSDSTVERNFGVALGHSLIGYMSALKGLEKSSVNEAKVVEELHKHPEVITEAYQTILRKKGYPNAYEEMKSLARGKKISMYDLAVFVGGLDVPTRVRRELLSITPENYTGLAEVLVDRF